MVMVEPSRFALTTTPSIDPSSADVTCPLRAVDCALASPGSSANAEMAVNATSSAALMRMNISPSASVERFKFDDRRAVVRSHPERHGVRGVVDVDAADVGGARQQVFDHFVGLRVEPR